MICNNKEILFLANYQLLAIINSTMTKEELLLFFKNKPQSLQVCSYQSSLKTYLLLMTLEAKS
jgi:hypothetical protein